RPLAIIDIVPKDGNMKLLCYNISFALFFACDGKVSNQVAENSAILLNGLGSSPECDTLTLLLINP
ncbi:MAG: hypothetical protein WCD24_02975, partial [Serratia inhibens]|uniref:hypothetical protein n=1 Tax=Serratia inhibens TaxID=2338073 RepID=UPI003C79A84C